MKNQEAKPKKGKEYLVDTLGVVTCSLALGTALDYYAGLRGWEIVGSRAYATAINAPTGGPYGKWRNLLYKLTKTTDKSSKARKTAVELLAFNTFQVPILYYSSWGGKFSIKPNKWRNKNRLR
jgi:hypothetical protein